MYQLDPYRFRLQTPIPLVFLLLAGLKEARGDCQAALHLREVCVTKI